MKTSKINDYSLFARTIMNFNTQLIKQVSQQFHTNRKKKSLEATDLFFFRNKHSSNLKNKNKQKILSNF